MTRVLQERYQTDLTGQRSIGSAGSEQLSNPADQSIDIEREPDELNLQIVFPEFLTTAPIGKSC